KPHHAGSKDPAYDLVPYTTERRADTGVTNVRMGVWLFIASEVMLFGALFSAYALLRTSATSWPSGLQLFGWTTPLWNTVILLLVAVGWWNARTAKDPSWHMLSSTAFALVFLVRKSGEYMTDVSHGLLPSTNTFLAVYFTLTGLHALHVAGGVVANLWVWRGIKRVSEALTAGRIHALKIYWTFVDIIWLIILVLIYLS